MTTAERGIGEDDIEECTASSSYFLSVQVGVRYSVGIYQSQTIVSWSWGSLNNLIRFLLFFS